MSEISQLALDKDDAVITLCLSVKRDVLERFNRLGLSDKTRRLALSYALQNGMEAMMDNPPELAWYIEQAAKLPDEPKIVVILPVVLSEKAAARYRVRCNDVGIEDMAKQASEDLTNLAMTW